MKKRTKKNEHILHETFVNSSHIVLGEYYQITDKDYHEASGLNDDLKMRVIKKIIANAHFLMKNKNRNLSQSMGNLNVWINWQAQEELVRFSANDFYRSFLFHSDAFWVDSNGLEDKSRPITVEERRLIGLKMIERYFFEKHGVSHSC